MSLDELLLSGSLPQSHLLPYKSALTGLAIRMWICLSESQESAHYRALFKEPGLMRITALFIGALHVSHYLPFTYVIKIN
jgi:hypothetical protein